MIGKGEQRNVNSVDDCILECWNVGTRDMFLEINLGPRMKGRGEKTKLNGLLEFIKGYNTIPHEAIKNIVGVIPFDLIVEEKISR